MGYRKEAIECVKDHVLPLHKQIYAKYEGISTGSTRKGTIASRIRVGLLSQGRFMN